MKKITVPFILSALFISLLAVGALAADGTAYAADRNIFAELYGVAIKHLDKILSLLTLIASVLLAASYKRTLLPIVKGALGRLASSAEAIKSDAEAANDAARHALDEAKECVEKTEATLSEITARLEELERGIAELGTADIKTALSAEIDLLYEIFMTSSLPLYQKEAVGEKISEMRRTLNKGECGE